MRWSRPSPAGFPMNTAEDRRLHLQNLGIGIGIDIPPVCERVELRWNRPRYRPRADGSRSNESESDDTPVNDFGFDVLRFCPLNEARSLR